GRAHAGGGAGGGGGPGRPPAGGGARRRPGRRRPREAGVASRLRAERRSTEGAPAGAGDPPVIPKAELHVHLEGTAPPDLIRRIAERNGLELPEGLLAEPDR